LITVIFFIDYNFIKEYWHVPYAYITCIIKFYTTGLKDFKITFLKRVKLFSRCMILRFFTFLVNVMTWCIPSI